MDIVIIQKVVELKFAFVLSKKKRVPPHKLVVNKIMQKVCLTT